MGLPEVINVDKSKCQHCLACLLVCPVKLCNIVEPDGISVNPDLCIGCGECIRACHEKGHKARTLVDDFPDFLHDLKENVPVGVMVAPAAAVNYDEHLPQMLTALRKMGVKYVFDVSFGAEITTYLYLKALESGIQTPIIAQPCPAIVSFIEIYNPELLPYLAPTHSPALDAAVWLKNQPEFEDVKLAFLGPCLGKRREVHDPNTKGLVSYSITFQSLSHYFETQGIELNVLEPSGFDTPEAERAVGYSQPGGLTETFKRFGVPVKKHDIPRVEGPQEVYQKYIPELLEDIRKGDGPVLVDILNCQYGCNVGPAVTHHKTHFQIDRIMDKRREKQIEKYKVQDPKVLFKEYYEWIEKQKLDFSRNYTDKASNRYIREPSLEEEEQTWALMHKNTQEERQINCASCGYGNCRGMMKAIVNGLNHLESCKYYLFKENEYHLKQIEAQTIEIEEQRDEIAAWNEVLEETVKQRTNALRNLLDNAGQGFLLFNSDLHVHPEYSAECKEIFSEEIDNKYFPELIYPYDQVQRDFLQQLLETIFTEKGEEIHEVYIPLLPNEVAIGSKYINLEYKLLTDEENENIQNKESCMVILTDITDQRLLESQVEQERNFLKMVVKVVVNYYDFIQNIKDYKRFCQQTIWDLISDSSKSKEIKVSEIFRHIHTFKGSFSQLGMVNIVKKLHEFETEISDFIKKLSMASEEDVKDFFAAFELEQWLEVDLHRLEEILGNQFLTQEEELTINKSKLIEIEKKIETLLSPVECNLLIPELRKLQYKPFDSLLKSFPEYISKLAEQNEKPIYPLVIEADTIMVDPERFKEFAKALLHIFRNAVDHGLEEIDERLENGKDEYGHIACKITSEDESIVIVIGDDGRGIKALDVKEKILNNKLLNKEDINSLTEEEIIQYIFMDGFSTKENVTELSGRGVGLAAVKNELTKLGGSIRITTQPGKGTEFIIKLPLESEELWKVSVTELMNPLIDTTIKYFEEQAGLNVKSKDYFYIDKPNSIELNKVTSIITIRGVMEMYFILSLDESVLRKLVRKFVIDDISEGDEDQYMEDVLAESTNIILGNSLKLFPGLEELVVIDAPVSLSSEEGLVKYLDSQIWTCKIQTESGYLSLGLVLPRDLDTVEDSIQL